MHTNVQKDQPKEYKGIQKIQQDEKKAKKLSYRAS